MNSWKVKPLAQATVAGFEPRCGFQACAVTSALQASDWEWPGERSVRGGGHCRYFRSRGRSPKV